MNDDEELDLCQCEYCLNERQEETNEDMEAYTAAQDVRASARARLEEMSVDDLRLFLTVTDRLYK